MRRFLKLLLANLAGLVAIWIGLLVLTSLIDDIGEVLRYAFPPIEARVDLPNYPDKARARQIFWDAKLTIEEYLPLVGWTRRPQQTETANIGADGFRTHRAGRDAGPEAPSVGIFGGSTTWGTGADDDSTISAFIDQLTSGYRVFNYAQGGWNARQNLAWLVNLIVEGRMPDIVVFYNGHNYDVHCYFEVANIHGNYSKMKRILEDRPRFGYVFHHIVTPSVESFRNILRQFRKGGSGGMCDEDPEHAERVAVQLVRTWEVANTIVEANGGRFYAFLQPTAFEGSPRLDHLELRKGDRGDQHRAFYPEVRARAASRPWFTDLTAAFDVDAYVYIDAAHVSPNGNEIIARRVIERLEAGGMTRSAP